MVLRIIENSSKQSSVSVDDQRRMHWSGQN
jgi:hypothetical protein